MAIEISSNPVDNEIKAAFPNAYLKVHDVEIRISSSEAWIRILIFANKEARDTEGACSIKKITERVPLSILKPETFDKAGIIAASYKWLKTQPKYQGIDV